MGQHNKKKNNLTFHHGCRFAFLYLQGAWSKNKRRGEGEKRRGPQLPQRYSLTDGQQSSRVHVANALANCEPPQTSPVN